MSFLNLLKSVQDPNEVEAKKTSITEQYLQQREKANAIGSVGDGAPKRKFTEAGPSSGVSSNVQCAVNEMNHLQTVAAQAAAYAESVKRQRMEALEAEQSSMISALPAALQEHHDMTKHIKAYNQKESKDTIEEAVKSRGVIEGGTWEHRKRAQEMAITAMKAAEATELAEQRHENSSRSVMSYLPQHVLEAFEKQQEQVKSGAVASSVPMGAAISSSNKGAKMLSKMGWKSGQGLGADGQGISQPIGPDTRNLSGAAGSSTVTPAANDDAFASFRKKNMLAYRFRPNPMNNPRRGYDGYDTLYDKSTTDGGLDNVASRILNGEKIE